MQVQVKGGTRGASFRGFPPVLVTVLVPMLFIALKLGSVIDWSWGWVVAPIWIPVLLALLVAAVVAAAFTLVKWLLMARAWLHFRRALPPGSPSPTPPSCPGSRPSGPSRRRRIRWNA